MSIKREYSVSWLVHIEWHLRLTHDWTSSWNSKHASSLESHRHWLLLSHHRLVLAHHLPRLHHLLLTAHWLWNSTNLRVLLLGGRHTSRQPINLELSLELLASELSYRLQEFVLLDHIIVECFLENVHCVIYRSIFTLKFEQLF